MRLCVAAAHFLRRDRAEVPFRGHLALVGSEETAGADDGGWAEAQGDVLHGVFATIQRTQPRVTSDGRLGYLRPSLLGSLELVLATVDAPFEAPQVLYKGEDHVQGFDFLPDARHVLVSHDSSGDERLCLELVAVATRRSVRLAENVQDWWAGDAAVLVAGPAGRPRAVTYALEAGGPRAVAAVENPGNATGFVVDGLTVLAAVRVDAAGKHLLWRDGESWRAVLTADEADELAPVGAAACVGAAAERCVLLRTNAGGDLVQLEQVDANGTRTVLFADPDQRADVDKVDIDATAGAVAVQTSWLAQNVTALPTHIAPDDRKLLRHGGYAAAFQYLKALEPDAAPWVVSRSKDVWVVLYSYPSRPSRYVAVDVASSRTWRLFDEIPWTRSARGGAPEAGFRMEAFEVPGGLDDAPLSAYLTLPAGSRGNLSGPLVVRVHGGPWARDEPTYEPEVHWLASRGYAVLRANFRGSKGFGHAFLTAGDGQWGEGMLDDVLRAARAATGDKPTKVAVMGESFGGYAAAALLTLPRFRDAHLACGVDAFGPTDLTALEASLPAKYDLQAHWLHERMKGDGNQSPLAFADSLRAPLLVAQGANDPRVPPAEARSFVSQARASGGDVTYVEYAQEGHGFTRTEDRLGYYAKVAAFLDSCLGKR